MTVSPITNNNTSGSADSTSEANSSNGLTMSDFLQLLTSEMENQDPLNPVSNDQFLAEMAQFSNLETTDTMSTTLTGMSNTLQQAGDQALIGQTVTLTDSNGNTVSGTVTQVGSSNGSAYVEVNGNQYNPSSITSIGATSTTN